MSFLSDTGINFPVLIVRAKVCRIQDERKILRDRFVSRPPGESVFSNRPGCAALQAWSVLLSGAAGRLLPPLIPVICRRLCGRSYKLFKRSNRYRHSLIAVSAGT